MPDNYRGDGYDNARNAPKSDSTSSFVRTWFRFNPKILWQFKKNWFVGPIINFTYTKGDDPSAGLAADPYNMKYNDKPFNSDPCVVFQYDSRDVPVNARGDQPSWSCILAWCRYSG